MTPEELPSPPRKSSWKRWTIALVCALVIAAAVFLLTTSRREHVTVKYVGSTNYHGQKMLLFKGTNGLPERISYYAAFFETSDDRHYPKLLTPATLQGATGAAGPRESFTFSLEAPPKGAAWRVGWFFSGKDRPPTRWEKFRSNCYRFLSNHRAYSLARLFSSQLSPHYIAASDLKE